MILNEIDIDNRRGTIETKDEVEHHQKFPFRNASLEPVEYRVSPRVSIIIKSIIIKYRSRRYTGRNKMVTPVQYQLLV